MAVVQRPPGRPASGLTAAVTSAATMAMFQPLMATTWVRPAVAKASLISGAIDARTPSRIPAPSAASGSGTRSFRPPSSVAADRRQHGSQVRPRRQAHRPIAHGRWRRCPGAPGTRGTRSRRSPRRSRSSGHDPQPIAGWPRRYLAAARRAADRRVAAGAPVRSGRRGHPRTSWSRSPRGRGSSTTVPTISCSAPSARLATDRRTRPALRRLLARQAPRPRGETGDTDDQPATGHEHGSPRHAGGRRRPASIGGRRERIDVGRPGFRPRRPPRTAGRTNRAAPTRSAQPAVASPVMSSSWPRWMTPAVDHVLRAS